MNYDVCHDRMLYKMFILSTFQHIVSILYIWPITSTNEIALSYTKRKSISCSLNSHIFRVDIYMNLCEKRVEEDNRSMKKIRGSFKYFNIFDRKMGGGVPKIWLHQKIAREKLHLLMYKYKRKTTAGLFNFYQQSPSLHTFDSHYTIFLSDVGSEDGNIPGI
jgi:hypothetical protein